MTLVKLLPAIISISLLAAHYYRAGLIPLVVIVGGSLLVLFAREKWAARIIQAELFIAGLEWIRTIISLVSVRQSMNMPWMRLTIILGAVAVAAFASTGVFRFQALKDRYKTG